MSPMSKRNKFLLLGVTIAAVLLAGGSPAFAAKHAANMAGAESSNSSAEESYTPPLPNEVTVSDRDFNQFVFPAAIVNGPIFPAGSPLLGKPVYLAGNTQVLLQVQPGSDKPFNMIVECANGAVYKFYLLPRPINGVTHRVEGASDRGKAHAAATETPVTSAPRGADVELLKRFVSGNAPDGFEPTDLPGITRFDKFNVIPLSGWSDGAHRVMTFSLVAVRGQTAVVAPPQFYRAGITAVMLDGEVVDAANSPTLYVVEEISDEQ